MYVAELATANTDTVSSDVEQLRAEVNTLNSNILNCEFSQGAISTIYNYNYTSNDSIVIPH